MFPPPAPEQPEEFAPAALTGTDINAEYGEFTCPVCWLRFDRGDVMHISVHGSLLGDPMLGDAALQRFHATRFNDRGQALDPMGIPAPDMACPHCRRKLPPGFLDLPHHIFSIIGAPSAGKSYYLSVLVKMLAASLYQNFGISFRDADPSENVLLNDMKTQLFSAATPQEAALAKTQLEGAMYERLPRFGRKVVLPRPFIFQLGKHPDPGFSIVFYDNAGEHFEPTRNSSDSPGAQHIAAASGLFFLFDPLTHPVFRRKLGEIDDPSRHAPPLGQCAHSSGYRERTSGLVRVHARRLKIMSKVYANHLLARAHSPKVTASRYPGGDSRWLGKCAPLPRSVRARLWAPSAHHRAGARCPLG